ncbi:MAG: ABC transporter ATP-binding protein [Oscillospiraceae bacterium]|nr:ABC transporter ATP-binding protein [Oscillospiraceae bacterium]
MDDRVILSARNLEVGFRVRGQTLTALRGVDLELYYGETLAIVGESGSGKSVLTKTFAGMLESNGRIQKGQILFDGQDLATLRRNRDWADIRGSKIATVFQDPMTSLNPILTIGRQLMDPIRAHQGCSRAEARRRALEMMEKVGIPNPERRFNDYPFQYSGGMRQRIVIAIALCCRPQILICDEPTTALDVTIQAQILGLIRQLQQELGYSILFITHDLGVVANVADRVAVLYAGQVVELGTAEDIFYDPRHPYTWALLSSLPQLAGRDRPLYSIPGAPPSLYRSIQGDAFAPRSEYRIKIDTLLSPPVFPVSDTHWARTWLLDPRCPSVEPPEQVKNLHSILLAGEERE